MIILIKNNKMFGMLVSPEHATLKRVVIAIGSECPDVDALDT
jgi:hypothetical protein